RLHASMTRPGPLACQRQSAVRFRHGCTGARSTCAPVAPGAADPPPAGAHRSGRRYARRRPARSLIRCDGLLALTLAAAANSAAGSAVAAGWRTWATSWAVSDRSGVDGGVDGGTGRYATDGAAV